MKCRSLIVLFLLIAGTLNAQVFNPYATNSGYVSSLVSQSGNGSSDIKVKISYVGNPAVKGNWDNVTAYGAGELRAYPSGSPIMWRVKSDQSVSAGEGPPISNSKWEMAVGIDMLQNMGSGKWARTTMQRDEGSWIKMGPVQVGTYTTTKFSYAPVISNYVGAAATTNLSTSSTSISIPTSHPSSRTITIGTGLTGISDSQTLGTCTDSFSIPTTIGTTMTRNLPTGLSLAPGETLVLYGDASNFIITVVGRYSSVTGVAYLALVQHVGSGSFSSWTLKKEQYRRIFRTDNALQHFHCLVQSYNSGTGALTVNSVKNSGSVTVANWTLALAKEVPDASGSQVTQINVLDAEALGYFFKVVGSGTSFEHNCVIDNRGTGFLYIYADGPMISSPPADVTIDTYNASTVSASSRVIFDNLTAGTHTFIAISITSPSGLSANTRTWAKSSSNTSTGIPTLNQYYNYDLFTADFEVCGHGQSVGEFAFRFRENADAGDGLSWMPFHGAFTMTSTPQFVIDGTTVSHTSDFTTGLNPYALTYQSFTTCLLYQSGDVIHPHATGSLGTYTSSHAFNRNGVDMSLTINWTVATFRATGYVNMLFLTKAFGKKIVLGKTGTVYTTPQSADPDVNITSGDLNSYSVLVHSDNTGSSGEDQYAFANYNAATSVPWASAFINNYDVTYNKLYNQTHTGAVIGAGTVEVIKSKWYIGKRGGL
jgi:hypothetical protein